MTRFFSLVKDKDFQNRNFIVMVQRVTLQSLVCLKWTKYIFLILSSLKSILHFNLKSQLCIQTIIESMSGIIMLLLYLVYSRTWIAVNNPCYEH